MTNLCLLLILYSFILCQGISRYDIEFSDRNIGTVIAFIRRVQVERNVPCVIFTFDVKIDLHSQFMNEEKFQFQSMLDSNPASIPACNILIGNFQFCTLDGVFIS